MADGLTLRVPSYDSTRGVVAPVEGGSVVVMLQDDAVLISADPAGLRDLARWCMVLSDPDAFSGCHVHLDPLTTPLTRSSLPLVITRRDDLGSSAESSA